MDNKRKQIARLLNIQDDNNWEIVDAMAEEGLYLINSSSGADTTRYGHLDRTLVDLNRKRVVLRGSKDYVHNDARDITVGLDDRLSFRNRQGLLRNIQKGVYTLRPDVEGLTVTCLNYEGKPLFVTDNLIDGRSGRCYKSRTFQELFLECGGPSESQFLPGMYYVFTIVHKDLLMCSRQNIGEGYIVYQERGYFLDISSGNNDIFHSQGSTGNGDVFQTLGYLPLSTVSRKGIYVIKDISVSEANGLLSYGYHPEISEQDLERLDRRLLPSERCLIIQKSSDPTPDDLTSPAQTYSYVTTGRDLCIHLRSEAYLWRLFVTDNDYNRKRRLCSLYTNALIVYDDKQALNDYLYAYPRLYNAPLYNLNDQNIYPFSTLESSSPVGETSTQALLIQSPQIPSFRSPQILSSTASIDVNLNLNLNSKYIIEGKIGELDTIGKRYQNILLCMLASVPLAKRLDVAGEYIQLLGDRESLIRILYKIWVSGDQDNLISSSSRAATVLSLSKNLYFAKGNISKLDALTTRVLEEKGANLWLMLNYLLYSYNP